MMRARSSSIPHRWLVLVLAPPAVWLALQLLEALPASDELDATVAPEPPRLWSPEPARCTEDRPPAALGLARQRGALAWDRGARRAFSPADGVVAVQLHESAAACYTRAGEPTLAAVHVRQSRQLRAEIQRALRTRHLRLQHALRTHDWDVARRQLHALRSLVRGHPGPYPNWLDRLAREVVASEEEDE